MKNSVIIFHGKKSGMGKTTLMLNIAAELSKRKHKVLIIDADGQGTTTTIIKQDFEDFEVESHKWFTYGGITKEDTKKYGLTFLVPSIKPSRIFNVDLVNGGSLLYKFSQSLIKKPNKEKYLGRNLMVMKEYLEYDYIFIDLNSIFDCLALNAYLAADSIITIVDRSEIGLTMLNETILDWQMKTEILGINNLIKGLVINRVNNSKMSKEILKTIHNDEDLSKIVFNTFIPETTMLEKSVVTGGIWATDVKRLDKWKPTQSLNKWLNNNDINYSIGHPIKTLVDEMFKRKIF